jgi:thioredoxin-like negative regulator of GroEL
MNNTLKDLKDVEIEDIEINEEGSLKLIEEYNISTVPTIVVCEDNEIVQKFIGITPIEVIKAALKDEDN